MAQQIRFMADEGDEVEVVPLEGGSIILTAIDKTGSTEDVEAVVQLDRDTAVLLANMIYDLLYEDEVEE